MLDAVGTPFIMSTAAQELLDRYPNHTDNPEDIIEEIINGQFMI